MNSNKNTIRKSYKLPENSALTQAEYDSLVGALIKKDEPRFMNYLKEQGYLPLTPSKQ